MSATQQCSSTLFVVPSKCERRLEGLFLIGLIDNDENVASSENTPNSRPEGKAYAQLAEKPYPLGPYIRLGPGYDISKLVGFVI